MRENARYVSFGAVRSAAFRACRRAIEGLVQCGHRPPLADFWRIAAELGGEGEIGRLFNATNVALSRSNAGPWTGQVAAAKPE